MKVVEVEEINKVLEIAVVQNQLLMQKETSRLRKQVSHLIKV